MKLLVSCLAIATITVLLSNPIHAQSMKNSSYILDLNANTSGGTNPDVTPVPPILTNNETSLPKAISGNNFISFLSYNEDTKHLPLVLSTSNDLLNFGIIQPGEPIIRTHALTVLPGSAQGYQVLSYQNHTLERDGVQIPNTTCDNGSCTSVLSDVWTIPLTYGFGYRCDNIANKPCAQDLKKDYYKSFANEKADEFPASVLTETENIKSQAIISYKVNIPGSQANKAYQTTIYHIATSNL